MKRSERERQEGEISKCAKDRENLLCKGERGEKEKVNDRMKERAERKRTTQRERERKNCMSAFTILFPGASFSEKKFFGLCSEIRFFPVRSQTGLAHVLLFNHFFLLSFVSVLSSDQ